MYPLQISFEWLVALIIPTDSWWSTWLGNYLTWVLSRDKVIIEMTSGVTGRLNWEHTHT